MDSFADATGYGGAAEIVDPELSGRPVASTADFLMLVRSFEFEWVIRGGSQHLQPRPP
jgi:hypothetical protein